MNLYIIGLPGAGKSTAARELAARWGWDHVDLDVEISSQAGRTIPEVFAEEGEEGFRRREAAALIQASERTQPTVVACGGGTPIFPANRERMLASGEMLWINPALEVLHHRLSVKEERASRPLLAGSDWSQAGREVLEGLLEQRAPHFRWARFQAEGIEAIQDALDAWAASCK